MNKIILIASTVLLSLTLNVQAKTLKIATVVPNGSSWMNEMRAAAKEVKLKTEGRVKIKFFPGGVMGSDAAVLRKMRIGQLQGGAIAAGSLASIYNGVQLYSLPFTFKNLDEVTYVRKHFDPIIAEGLAKKDMALLGLSEGGFAYLMSNAKATSAGDLANHKVWVPEGDIIGQEIFEVGNIQPIPQSVADVYTSLQTGLLDTVTINPAGAIALQWHTKINHVADKPLLLIMGAIVVDQKAFKKISAEDQATVKLAIQTAFKRLDKANKIGDEGARNALIKGGVSFNKPNEVESQQWEDIAAKALLNLKAKNAYPAALYEELQKMLQAYRSQQTK
jgi:TRAP-type C4-dicarboxylate transport system substrate-binding protein